MKKYIQGNVRKIVYQSPTSSYKVGIFKVRETNIEELNEYVDKIISFTGQFTELNTELDYIFYGELVNHPKYGVQFSTENYEVKEPTDEDSIILYLSSGIFRGMGLKTSKKIVEMFGLKTIDTIKNNYTDLTKVSGISLQKAEYLHNRIMDSEMNQDMIIKLNAFGFTIKEAIDLINIYKSNTLSIVNNNIYDLVEYISFDKLDKIYLKSNDEDTKERIIALIKNNITKMCYESGDTMVTIEELFISMKKCFLGNFDTDKFIVHLNELKKNNSIIEINNMIMLNDFYDTENFLFNSIMKLNSIKTTAKEEKIVKLLDAYENRNGIEFSDEQRTAIIESVKNNFYIITGGPGTGKTTIIKAIVEIILDLELCLPNELALLAPTGRSAKRMCESILYPAYTIHKYLKWNKETNSFQVDEQNKSKDKIIIVDESSMIDIFLFSSLLKGLKSNIKLILVGDSNQLPSIGPGDILNDLLTHDMLKHTILNQIYRVKKGSYITYLANDIKNRKELVNSNNYDDFKFIESSDDNIMTYVKELCSKAIEKGLRPENFQVLAPMYKGINGIDNLNEVLASIFNPNETKYSIGDKYYRVNDKVIQLVNDMDNNVYNGDIGYISSIEYINKKLLVTINFMGNFVEYSPGEFDHFSLAYAISIHKSQGSEYENVIIILAKSFARMFYNKLIYTAVTRAKKSLTIIGSVDSFNKSINTSYAQNRRTYLKNV